MITNITEREAELRAANADLRTEIERLELEALAADIRIENDKMDIAGLTREQVGLKLDAARLEWAMNNMCQHNYTLFGMHVMNVGGTGDIHDCRSFIDSMKGGVE